MLSLHRGEKGGGDVWREGDIWRGRMEGGGVCRGVVSELAAFITTFLIWEVSLLQYRNILRV